ncbi:MAG: RidA family protein [Halobacteriales archaeon]
MPEQIHTDDAFDSTSPYSQAIKHGDTVYVAGQVPLDPDTGELVGEDVQEQTEQVFENMTAILDAAGTSLDNVVKATVFLTDIDDFDAFNEVYAEHMPEPRPARSAVEVADLAGDFVVEVEVIAAV